MRRMLLALLAVPSLALAQAAAPELKLSVAVAPAFPLGASAKAWGQAMAAAGAGPLGHRVLATTGKVVRAPADLAALRVRATGGPLVVETLATLGARPQAMSFAQAQEALAAGTIDAQDGLATSFVAARLPATGYKQLVRWGAFGDAMVFAVRRAVWDGFTDAQRRTALAT